MECCGNTIKDLYGFSCPLKCSTYILQSVVHLKSLLAHKLAGSYKIKSYYTAGLTIKQTRFYTGFV